MLRIIIYGITIPIIPGIMPIYSVKMTEMLSAVCGTAIPDTVRDTIAKVPADDKEGVARYGIDLAIRQCRDLLKNGVPGLHFYTMNRGKSVHEIVTALEKEGLV